MSAQRPQSLPAVEAVCWDELERASQDRLHGWRTMTLATTDGEAAQARTVILREADREQRALLFFTDARSAKVREIAAHPLGTLLLWCASLGWQLRLRVQLQVETSGLAVSSRWAQLKLTPAAQDYLSPLPPGTPLGRIPTPDRSTRDSFALVHAQVQAMDWLELHPDGARRACFDAQGGRWVQP